jgi:precorrin isomerase
METFVQHAFGPERVLEVAELVEDARRLAERLVHASADVALRRALRHQLRELRQTADANRWVQEGDIAAVLAELPVTPNDVRLSAHQVRVGLTRLQRLIKDRLAHAIELHRLVAA